MKRLPRRTGELLDRRKALSIQLDGRRVQAFEGDTIGSVMAAAGITITGRSFKYHRPRGLYCMTGACPNCLVTVDGVPNVRACTEPVRPRMRVRRQNAWPSADRDLLGAFDMFGFALPAGFYYKVFHRPAFVWPMVEPIIRRIAGLGKAPEGRDAANYERVNVYPEVLVIGGGRAGLTAATETARAGRRTMVLEQRDQCGGRLLSSSIDTVQQLLQAAAAAGVEIQTSTAAFGVFEGPLVAAAGAGFLLHVHAQEIIFATGQIEQGAVFTNNDLPGIMLSEAVDRLVNLYGVLPGENAVVVGYGPQGRETAASLQQAGANVTLVDPHREPVERAVGGRRVRGVVLSSPLGPTHLSCDLLVLAGIMAPATSLLSQAGARLRLHEGTQAFFPSELPEGMRAVGSVAGPAAAPKMPPPVAPKYGKQFACICMDVTEKEIRQAIEEGFDSVELLKRYTTLTMGPCQGKACLTNSLRLCAHLTNRSLLHTDRPTARPPWTPVSLGVLAAGHLVPRKETAIHDRHVDAGAEFMWAGDWRRPHHYEDPAAECGAVHQRVALIDVSSLGKFRVKGPDAVELLERLYPGNLGDLKVGRIRYGAMLNDQGVILDDGTVCRLAEDEFFVTTTTGGTAGMEQWIKWWLADWGLDVRLINLSGGYAAVNLAGPHARKVMQRLTNLDVTAEKLPYLMSARGDIAGVPALILRIGFVGELSYEIHMPSAYGQHIWDAIMEAGRDLGIAAFGLEAQRVLRLEKQHIIVGQDTDALSTPYGAGMTWMVKFEKSDFLGRQSLMDIREQGPTERLVGFMVDERQPPPEGAAVVDAGHPVGRVCSSRWSEIMNSTIGLAWVPARWAEDERMFEIAYDGRRASAKIVLRPFYDPEGKRVRS